MGQVTGIDLTKPSNARSHWSCLSCWTLSSTSSVHCHHHCRHPVVIIVVLIREVELNLVTDGLDSILHQPECNSWQAEYTQIGTENGVASSWSSSQSSLWSSSRSSSRSSSWWSSRSSSWWSSGSPSRCSSQLLLGTAWLTQNGHLVLEVGQHQVKNIDTV